VEALTATVRRLAGATDEDATPDGDVVAALTAHRMWLGDMPLVWMPALAAGALREYRVAVAAVWGRIDTDDAVVTNSSGVTLDPTDFAIDDAGVVTFTDDQGPATYYLSGFGYDVHAAAADLVDARVALTAGDYDVKLGDQTFNRSQAIGGLRALSSSLRAKVLPSMTRLVRMDEAPSAPRLRTRRGQR